VRGSDEDVDRGVAVLRLELLGELDHPRDLALVVDRQPRRLGLVLEREVRLELVPPLYDVRIAPDRPQRLRIGRRQRRKADLVPDELVQSGAPPS
jgi:hypothetical protein